MGVAETEKIVAKNPVARKNVAVPGGASSTALPELYCPLCGAATEKHTGVIDEPVMTGVGIRRAHRLGTYRLCVGCEWGEEVR